MEALSAAAVSRRLLGLKVMTGSSLIATRGRELSETRGEACDPARALCLCLRDILSLSRSRTLIDARTSDIGRSACSNVPPVMDNRSARRDRSMGDIIMFFPLTGSEKDFPAVFPVRGDIGQLEMLEEPPDMSLFTGGAGGFLP